MRQRNYKQPLALHFSLLILKAMTFVYLSRYRAEIVEENVHDEYYV